MADIKQAIEYAKTNPNTPFATELRKRIESGQMDTELKSAGLNDFISTPIKTGVVENVKGTIKSAGEEYGKIIGSNEGNVIQRGIQAFGTAARGVGQVGMDVLGTIPGFTKGAKAVGDIASKGIEKTVGAISDIPAVQRAAQGLTPELEQQLKTVSSLGEISGLPLAGAGVAKTATGAIKGLAATPKALATLAEATGKGIKQIPQAITKTGNYVVDTLATENPAKLAKIKTSVANNLNEYSQEFTKSRNAIAGATNKIEGFDYGKHVSERGLLPNVTDSGRFDGTEIVKGLEAENKGFRDIISSKLESSTKTTPVESLRQALLEDVTSKSNIGDADSIRTYVDKYINEIRNRYGDNLTDKQIYDIKVDADAGYNYASPNADINASKIIADRARKFIRGDKEIADALDAQSKNYEAIRITKALEPQKVKAGTLSTRLAQLGGSLLGAGAVEGGVLQKTLAATLGGLAGGKLVKAIQQAAFISPAARASIKKELLKATSEEVAKTVLKKLDNGIVNLAEKEMSLLQKIGEKIKNTPNKQGGFAKNPFFKKSDALTEKVADAIDSIDTNPVKVDGKLEFGNVDDIFELDKAKRRINTGRPLTEAEAEAYIPLLKRNGIDVYKELDNATGGVETSLINEAKKYKTADEFIKKQPIVYHGSSETIKGFDNKRGTFFTDDYMNADGYAGGENVYEGYIELKKPLVIDAKGKKWDDLKTEYGKTTQEVVKNVDSKKHDGVIFKNIKDSWIDDADAQDPSTIYYAFKPADSFKNKSQLEEIFKKASKK